MLFLWFPFQKIQNPPDMITESQVREYLHEGICDRCSSNVYGDGEVRRFA